MAAVIRKAETAGAAFGAVRDSNCPLHPGFATFSPMKALLQAGQAGVRP